MIDFNTPSNLEACRVVVNQARAVLFYSHIPTSIFALLVGIFVFVKNSKSLLSKILLSISVLFCLWSTIDLLIWLYYDRDTLIMFLWSFFGIITALIFLLSLYFVYVFIYKKDVSFARKIIFSIPIFPIILLTPTRFNLTNFDIVNCVSNENDYFVSYYHLFGLFLAIFIIIIAIWNYVKTKNKEIIILTVGIEFFLLSLFTASYLSSLATNWGLDQYVLEQYGLFGMPIFLGFLGYLIVRYEIFNIKLIGARAFVAILLVLIGSELFLATNQTNRILITITFLLSLGFGYMLVKSVELEVKRKEDLQKMADSLAIANDKLRKLDNAKTEFISIASHQLRTPLTAIKGFVSLLLEGSYGKITPSLTDVLNKIYLSNERLITLVEDLLNVSRIESGRMEYKFEKVQLADLIREIYDTFTIRARDAHLKFELKLPKNPPEAMTDRAKIREVISNLVDNALKYTPKGWVKVTLSDAGQNVRVAISDTGIGVPKDEMPYLFQKFSRGKDVSRLNTGGTGLGLHVGKKMIEALHGTIGVESEGANHGSTFWVEVPKEAEAEN